MKSFNIVGVIENKVLLSYADKEQMKFIYVNTEKFMELLKQNKTHGFRWSSDSIYISRIIDELCSLSTYIREDEVINLLPQLSRFEADFICRTLKTDHRARSVDLPRVLLSVMGISIYNNFMISVAVSDYESSKQFNDCYRNICTYIYTNQGCAVKVKSNYYAIMDLFKALQSDFNVVINMQSFQKHQEEIEYNYSDFQYQTIERTIKRRNDETIKRLVAL